MQSWLTVLNPIADRIQKGCIFLKLRPLQTDPLYSKHTWGSTKGETKQKKALIHRTTNTKQSFLGEGRKPHNS